MFIRGLASLLLGVVFSGCGGTSTEAEDAGNGSWGQTYTKEETDWERDWSAGEVGCSPDEIQIQDMSGWGGNKTWSASCQGRFYHCTSRHAVGGYGADHDVSCTLAGGSAGAPVAARREQVEWATTALPTQAIGYTFGDDFSTTAKSCLDANNRWTMEAKQFRCSGLPVDVGLPGQSTVAFCDGKLCVVTAYLLLSETEQAGRILEVIANDLVKKYGAPTRQRRIREPVCDESFIECVEQAEASWEAIWKWNTGEILRATTLVKDKKAYLAVRYQLGEPDSTDALKSNGDKVPIDTSAF